LFVCLFVCLWHAGTCRAQRRSCACDSGCGCRALANGELMHRWQASGRDERHLHPFESDRSLRWPFGADSSRYNECTVQLPSASARLPPCSAVGNRRATPSCRLSCYGISWPAAAPVSCTLHCAREKRVCSSLRQRYPFIGTIQIHEMKQEPR
jgi:hypothetical protein